MKPFTKEQAIEKIENSDYNLFCPVCFCEVKTDDRKIKYCSNEDCPCEAGFEGE